MRKSYLVVVCLLCVAVALTGCPGRPGQKTELDGTWYLSLDEYGADGRMELRFRNGRMTARTRMRIDFGGDWMETSTAMSGDFESDTSASPRQVDVYYDRITIRIADAYGVDEETFTIEEYMDEFGDVLDLLGELLDEYGAAPRLVERDGKQTLHTMGIYRISGDELTVQWSSAARPAEFEEGFAITYERQ